MISIYKSIIPDSIAIARKILNNFYLIIGIKISI